MPFLISIASFFPEFVLEQAGEFFDGGFGVVAVGENAQRRSLVAARMIICMTLLPSAE